MLALPRLCGDIDWMLTTLDWAICLLVSIVWLLLTLFGALSDRTIYERSLGTNINLWWVWSCSCSAQSCSWSDGGGHAQRSEKDLFYE